MSPEQAAAEVHTRLAQLSAPLRRAALAWLQPEAELTAQLARAPRGPLHGVPYFLKDLFDLAHVPTHAGSTFLDRVRPLPNQDSRLTQTLAAAGAVCAGKSHLVEFASGLTGENPHYGDCPHPQFPDRLTGGSSSGSAALVAAGVVPLAIGTDTGGSVRVPAAWCGLYGFRLTPHDAFIRDAFPLASSLDTAGWFTATAADMLTSWQALATASSVEPAGAPRGRYLPAKSMLPGCDSEVASACDAAAAALCAASEPAMTERLLDGWRDAVDSYVTIGMSEANAVHRAWLEPHRAEYDPVIWQRFHDAGNLPAAQITRARQRMAETRKQLLAYFSAFDFLILPAVPTAAPRKTDATPEFRKAILTLTAPASLAGLPVLTLPVPLSSGLTAGLQVILARANSPVVPALLTSFTRR